MEKIEKKFITNSEIGSHHWFQTLVGQVIRCGEFIENHPNHELVKTYGNRIKETMVFVAKHQREINKTEYTSHPQEVAELPSDVLDICKMLYHNHLKPEYATQLLSSKLSPTVKDEHELLKKGMANASNKALSNFIKSENGEDLFESPVKEPVSEERIINMLLSGNLFLGVDDGERTNYEPLTIEDAKYIVEEKLLNATIQPSYSEEEIERIKLALKLAQDCTYADEMTDGAKEYLRTEIKKALSLINTEKK
jgi:hypothetical protein